MGVIRRSDSPRLGMQIGMRFAFVSPANRGVRNFDACPRKAVNRRAAGVSFSFFRRRSFNTANGLMNFARWAMEIIELEPSVSADGRAVIFQLSARGRELECAVTREALEQHFWLQRDAGEERVLKTFADGRKRIIAVAERKMLARPGEKVLLTISDFAARG